MKTLILSAVMLTTLLSGCVVKSGTHIRTGDVMPATNVDQVKLYSIQPKSFKVLGIVSGKGSHAFVSEQTRMDAAIGRMKHEAAALGANGILLQSAGSIQATNAVTQMVGNTMISTRANDAATSGTAIFVTEE